MESRADEGKKRGFRGPRELRKACGIVGGGSASAKKTQGAPSRWKEKRDGMDVRKETKMVP